MRINLPVQSTGRIFVLIAVCLAAVSLPLSFSGGAVATPAIGRDLGGDPAAMNWITNAFMLTFGSLLMAAGTLADRFGRKKVFAYGAAGFAVTSLSVGFAPTILMVDLLRGAQGLFAAAALAGGSAALAQEYVGGARTWAFSVLGTTFGIGLAFGPVLAGLLISHFGWRAIFAASTLTAALSLAIGGPLMRESTDPDARELDIAGTSSFTGALTFFTCGLIEAPSHGWASPLVASLFCGFVLCAAAFVFVEMRVKRPMLDLSLFRYPRFIGVQVLPIATCYCYVVLLVLLPLRFIGFDGRSALQAGITMLALSSPMVAVPLLAGAVTRWLSPGIVCGIGLLLAAGGVYTLGIALRGETATATILPMLAIGIGAGLPWGLMDGLSVSVVPKERAGMATGIFSTTRVAGEGVALATVTAILAALIQNSLQAAMPHATHAVLYAASDRLAGGDLVGASDQVPEIATVTLRAIYQSAFDRLLKVLGVITLLCALAVFAFLGRFETRDAPVVVKA